MPEDDDALSNVSGGSPHQDLGQGKDEASSRLRGCFNLTGERRGQRAAVPALAGMALGGHFGERHVGSVLS
ncbi:hypothetical protein ACFY1Q_31350 [Streptomyces albidoflavus]|uniref:hypothetical protein n=1 Tax=Streptomyces TaxID=1883 RepID=UPI00131BF1C3|nr:hypothetical protein [Streptomyces sp. NRRL F-6628]MCX5462529.1 hypothetical protein [Streptomyces sp. FT1]